MEAENDNGRRFSKRMAMDLGTSFEPTKKLGVRMRTQQNNQKL